MIPKIATASTWQRASKAFINFFKKISGYQEEEGSEENSNLKEDESEDDTADELEFDRRGGKKERKKIVFDK